MTPRQCDYVCQLVGAHFADRPKQSVADWCCEFLRFNEPKNNGPFSLAGREYVREILDCWADQAISDMVQLFGSQAGKTASIQGGAAWTIKHNPSRFLWVMPTRDLCRDFSRNRWMTMVQSSPVLQELIPTGGMNRFKFSTLQQSIGSALVGFAWSNSPTALSSNPCDVVILDEVDKFNQGGTKEADAVNLADQRTKNTANPKRIKTTTPTLTDGLGWREFLKTDQRRRFVPCPHCGRDHPSSRQMVLIWNKDFTVFKPTGMEAQVRWDKEARRADGSWDLDRVSRSARFECPHCGGHILDAHKTVMDRQGVWTPTATAAAGYRGWHLPSLYASAKETNVGRLAVKFLQAKQSLEGLQGFINGDLAEPYASQDVSSRRVEIVTQKATDALTGRVTLMFVDVQKLGFWYVIKIFGGGEAHTIDAGWLDSWERVEEKQAQHKIPNEAVTVDSGDNTKGTGASVYVQCAEHSIALRQRDALPTMVGWTPSKGMPGHHRWRCRDAGVMLPYRSVELDPYDGTSRAGLVTIGLFEFAADYFKDCLQRMRQGKGPCVWSVEPSFAPFALKDQEPLELSEFWRHMDGEYKKPEFNRRTGRTTERWVGRGRDWPNHLLDCENGLLARATALGLMKTE